MRAGQHRQARAAALPVPPPNGNSYYQLSTAKLVEISGVGKSGFELSSHSDCYRIFELERWFG
ncbi:hypothetical protein MJO28_017448 [Puccinia striiformis f. sp. tritici]|nr:hypothetical protein MJO28_017448 [Puccinia striiformis f. sp. tritici]